MWNSCAKLAGLSYAKILPELRHVSLISHIHLENGANLEMVIANLEPKIYIEALLLQHLLGMQAAKSDLS